MQVYGTIYFVALPTLVIIAAFFAAYLRHKLVVGGSLLMQCCAIALLCRLFLYRGEFFKASRLSQSLLPASHLS
jgi:hypothetical protein